MNLTMKRIANAQRARDNSSNPMFKEYWQKVIKHLQQKLN